MKKCVCSIQFKIETKVLHNFYRQFFGLFLFLKMILLEHVLSLIYVHDFMLFSFRDFNNQKVPFNVWVLTVDNLDCTSYTFMEVTEATCEFVH